MKMVIVLLTLFCSQAFAANECFSTYRVHNFTEATNTSVTIQTRDGDYHLELGFCSELPFAHQIGFDSFSSNVCWGDNLLVLDNFSNRVIESCHIFSINKATTAP